MNKSNAHLFLPLVQALAAGKTIEMSTAGRWYPIPNPSFSEEPERYRIKTVKVTKYAVTALWADSKVATMCTDMYNSKDAADSVVTWMASNWPAASFKVVEVSWEE